MIKCSYAFVLHTTDFGYSIFHLRFLIWIFNLMANLMVIITNADFLGGLVTFFTYDSDMHG